MDEGYRLRWQLVVLADAIAIAICLLLIYEYVGFEGAGILPTVVCPIMSVIASIGVVMWANGSGAKFTNGPKWETMNEGQTAYAGSVMGLHLAIGITLMACGVPLIMAGTLGIVFFIILLLSGIGVLFWGMFRVFTGPRIGNKRFVAKNPTVVWGFFILLLFAIVAVPVLVAESSGSNGADVNLYDDRFTVDAPMAHFSIDYDDVTPENVNIDYHFDRGTRTSGFSDLMISSGTYKNDALGTYKLASYDSCGACIVIKTDSGNYYAFNQQTESETESLYNELCLRIS